MLAAVPWLTLQARQLGQLEPVLLLASEASPPVQAFLMTTEEADVLLRTTCSVLAAQPWLIRKRASRAARTHAPACLRHLLASAGVPDDDGGGSAAAGSARRASRRALAHLQAWRLGRLLQAHWAAAAAAKPTGAKNLIKKPVHTT